MRIWFLQIFARPKKTHEPRTWCIYGYRFIYVFRYPPADACQKLKDVLNVVDFFDDEPDIDEADELREILTHYHMKTLLQVFIFWINLGQFLGQFWVQFWEQFWDNFETISGTEINWERNFDALSH